MPPTLELNVMTEPASDDDQIDDLVTVATFRSPQEASITKAALSCEGIEAFIQGAASSSMLSYYGSSVAGASLQVRQSEAERAAVLLADFESAARKTDETASPWQCANCGAEVDGGFELCWSCGNEFDEQTQTTSFSSSTPGQPPIESHTTSELAAENAISPQDTTADQTVDRAWRAAVWGIVLFPFWFYSLFLVIEVSGKEISRTALWKFYGTLVILVCAFFVLSFSVVLFK